MHPYPVSSPLKTDTFQVWPLLMLWTIGIHKQGCTYMGNTEAGVVLLLVEDDADMRSLLCDELSEMGHHIVEAADADQALKYVLDRKPSLIMTDLRMPAGGMGYVSRLRKCAPDVPIILMTAFGDAKTKAEALGLGVAAYFDKPVRISELKQKVEQLLNAA